jgi:peptidoglycan/LPS O-acetylase OafA/YrhL
MNSRKWGALILAVATIIVIGHTIYKAITGKEVGFNEISTLAILLMMFLSAITWGSKEKKDGISPKEELGRKIMEKSAVISYYILLFIIMIAVFTDELVNGTTNIFLLGVLGLAMVLLPLVEFLVARKYQ